MVNVLAASSLCKAGRRRGSLYGESAGNPAAALGSRAVIEMPVALLGIARVVARGGLASPNTPTYNVWHSFQLSHITTARRASGSSCSGRPAFSFLQLGRQIGFSPRAYSCFHETAWHFALLA